MDFDMACADALETARLHGVYMVVLSNGPEYWPTMLHEYQSHPDDWRGWHYIRGYWPQSDTGVIRIVVAY